MTRCWGFQERCFRDDLIVMRRTADSWVRRNPQPAPAGTLLWKGPVRTAADGGFRSGGATELASTLTGYEGDNLSFQNRKFAGRPF